MVPLLVPCDERGNILSSIRSHSSLRSMRDCRLFLGLVISGAASLFSPTGFGSSQYLSLPPGCVSGRGVEPDTSELDADCGVFSWLPLDGGSRDLSEGMIPNSAEKWRRNEAQAGMQATMIAKFNSTMLIGFSYNSEANVTHSLCCL